MKYLASVTTLQTQSANRTSILTTSTLHSHYKTEPTYPQQGGNESPSAEDVKGSSALLVLMPKRNDSKN
ncbi:hypothetical protein H4Q26_011866 [Puccinia striiformis f. sp. tritici PST-130]|nr:hypothetical protein H4Q26_011866 [Puccinia striiformis f. sp. tritici PST-130]